MKLTDLEATFIGEFKTFKNKQNENGIQFTHLKSIEKAQGVLFICPKCQNHSIIVWLANPLNVGIVNPKDTPRNEKRWNFTGKSIEDLTLVPSIDLSIIDKDNPASKARCYWHGFVQFGDAK